MATRSLSDVFILMRNNAIQRRNIYSEQNTTDRMALVSLNNIEEGGYGINGTNEYSMPPAWISQLEEAQYSFSKLRDKINDLKALHLKHYNRPPFDESSKEEADIEHLSQEISRMFNSTHRLVQHIKNQIYEGSRKEQRLTANVVRALAASLQELSTNFRVTQSSYLRQINSREENTQNYFDALNFEPDGEMWSQGNSADNNIDDFFMGRQAQKQMTQQQLVLLEEENSRVALEREREINQIVRSILEINDIYKDLAQMVTDQGTVLDRIDYNVELTHIQVQEGFKQIKKAAAYQRKNMKICCILILAATTILLTFILIIVKL